jgi:Protein of unknown function (DUF4007)
MARGPIFDSGYKPQLSGHETFPLRYGWLKKAFDAVYERDDDPDNKTVFRGDDAIARFGVGRNMVASIRHWAAAAGITDDLPGGPTVRTTATGRLLFGPKGLDPYMEHPATLWLIHWNISGSPFKTTWFWAFNHFPALTFERDHLIKGLGKLAKDLQWPRASATTLKNDVACFIRTYVAVPASGESGQEDVLESPLTELSLIKAMGKRDGFRFIRGAKPSLGSGVFAYALNDFWLQHSNTSTLSFEAIAHEPGSPGRVFLLDEEDLIERLAELEDATGGAFRWSETAGLKQVIREADIGREDALSYVELDYTVSGQKEAA